MMKKSVLVFSLTLLLIFNGLNLAVGQEQPKPKKDTVNMDTDAKPTFYYPTEDEKGSKGKSPVVTIGIIAGAVVVAGAAAYFFLKKKK
jgi:LPXTG-motif cell wall-anchored protein